MANKHPIFQIQDAFTKDTEDSGERQDCQTILYSYLEIAVIDSRHKNQTQ